MNRSTHISSAVRVGILGALGFGNICFDKSGEAMAAPAAAPAEPYKAIREEYSRLIREGETVVQTATAENRDMTDAEKAANETRFSRITQIKNLLDERQRFASLVLADDPEQQGSDAPARQSTIQHPTNPPGKDAADRATFAGVAKLDRAEFGRALSRWGATGDMDRKFATITTATSSGALLPRMIAEPLTPTAANVFRQALALTGMEPLVTEGTGDLTLPVMDAAAGGQVAENASSETTNEPSLAESIRLPMKTYQSGTAWMSNLQLGATDYDLGNYLQTSLSYSKELGLESTAIAAMIADAGITQEVATATTTGFTYANLVDLNNKLPKRYQRQQVILLSATAYSAAEKLIGDDGHPVLNKDPQDQRLLRFNGTPVIRCDYLESLVANKCVGLVISMLGFRLRDRSVENLTRYTQNQAKPDQTGFNLFSYHAYGYAPSAVAKLKTPVS